jgi:hypothetical protein
VTSFRRMWVPQHRIKGEQEWQVTKLFDASVAFPSQLPPPRDAATATEYNTFSQVVVVVIEANPHKPQTVSAHMLHRLAASRNLGGASLGILKYLPIWDDGNSCSVDTIADVSMSSTGGRRVCVKALCGRRCVDTLNHDHGVKCMHVRDSLYRTLHGALARHGVNYFCMSELKVSAIST